MIQFYLSISLSIPCCLMGCQTLRTADGAMVSSHHLAAAAAKSVNEVVT